MKHYLMIIALLALTLSVSAQEQAPPGFAVARGFVPEVLNEYPHDTSAFTQGLIWHEGFLYESTGQRGESTLRQVALETGEVLRRVDVNRPPESTEPNYFGEGLELVDGQLIQLTWTAGEALVYDFETFEQVDTYRYEGEGWGLCDDGRYLYMSDSSRYISIRERDSFDLITRMLITINGQPVNQNLLNELECVGDSIYANLWQTDFIVEIDKFTGNILTVIDAADLLSADERAELGSGAVLNGIAYNPESDTFYITGKDWPKLFEVRFIPADDET